ncbi:MAG: hypothetical protein AB7T14_09920 [Candidatus Methylacidiphilaceae bacterium]
MPTSLRFALQSLNTAFGLVVRTAPAPALGVGLLYLVLTRLLQPAGSFRFWHGRLATILVILISQAILGILVVGLARFFLSLSDGRSPRFLELLDGFRAPWKALAGALFGWLVGMIALLTILIPGSAPLALLLLPGVLPLVMFGPFLIADGAVSHMLDAFLESFRLGVTHYAKALAVAITVVVLVDIGGLLILGPVISIPLCYTITAVAYRGLVTQPR